MRDGAGPACRAMRPVSSTSGRPPQLISLRMMLNIYIVPNNRRPDRRSRAAVPQQQGVKDLSAIGRPVRGDSARRCGDSAGLRCLPKFELVQ